VTDIISDIVRPLASAAVIEKQRVEAKTMLREELAKSEPSPA